MKHPEGTIVRMTRKYRTMLRWALLPRWLTGHRRVLFNRKHIQEFGRSIGIVLGEVEWTRIDKGPEVNVRWQGTGLKYLYHPDDLEVVPGMTHEQFAKKDKL